MGTDGGDGGLIEALVRGYRRSGADVPGGDPRPTHGAQMEGWFWRLTDVARGRVVVALCGVNRHPDGDWATVAVAAHPGDVVRSAAVDGAWASDRRLQVRAGSVLAADEAGLRVDLDDLHLDLRFEDLVPWPLRLGAGGVFSALPFLGQYWHPHVLGGRALGHLEVGGDAWDLGGGQVYAEKNWGAGFPDRWWWGQAQGFARHPDLCVAFGGGRLRAGPVGLDVTGCVVRTGDRVLRFAPPLARVRSQVGKGRWHVAARRGSWHLDIEGDGGGRVPAVLPVPLPAERRNVQRDLEHLAGHLRVRLSHGSRLHLEDESELAALEVGTLDPSEAAALAVEVGVPREAVG